MNFSSIVKHSFVTKLLVGLILAVSVLGASLVSTSFVSAQGANNLDDAAKECNVKIKKQACITAINKCNTTACKNAAPSRFSNVYQDCRSRPNPQNCHNRVKTECADKPAGSAAFRACAAIVAIAPTVSNFSNDAAFSLDAEGTVRDTCGSGDNAVKTRFDFGCTGEGGPIEDFAFAIIRFLSFGVGIILAASIIYAGIMYSTSGGNPEQTQASKKRILNAMVALVFYVLIFALIQFLVPGGLFK